MISGFGITKLRKKYLPPLRRVVKTEIYRKGWGVVAWTVPFYVTDGPACEEVYLGGAFTIYKRDIQRFLELQHDMPARINSPEPSHVRKN